MLKICLAVVDYVVGTVDSAAIFIIAFFTVVDDINVGAVVGNNVAGFWSCFCSVFGLYKSTVIPYVLLMKEMVGNRENYA